MRSRLLWLPLLLVACVPTPPSSTAGTDPPRGSVMPTDGQPGPEAVGTPPSSGDGAASGMPGGINAAEPCGDGVCDQPEQENPALCPRDCQEQPTTGDDWCGDGICDAKESLKASCPADCAEQVPAGAGGPGSEPPPGAPPPVEPPRETPPEGDAPAGPPPEGAPTAPPAEGEEPEPSAMPPAR